MNHWGIATSVLVTCGLCAVTVAGPTTRAIGKTAAIAIPDGWQAYRADQYSPSVSICDPSGRAFLWVSGDSKDDFVGFSLEDYAGQCVAWIVENLEDAQPSETTELTINEFRALRVEVRGVKERVRWIYTYTLIEGDTSYYMIMLATRPSGLEFGRAAMEQVVASFNQLSGASQSASPTTTPGK